MFYNKSKKFTNSRNVSLRYLHIAYIENRENASQCYVFDFYLTITKLVTYLIFIYTFHHNVMTSSNLANSYLYVLQRRYARP